MISATREERISGHMPMRRRSSWEVKPMEVRRKWTVDFMWGRGEERIGGWWLIKEKKSRPIESR